jgi:hypothetical protein
MNLYLAAETILHTHELASCEKEITHHLIPHHFTPSQNVFNCAKSLFRASKITTATSLRPPYQWLPRSRKIHHRKISLFFTNTSNTPHRLLDNHLIIDAAHAIIPDRSPSNYALRKKF